LTVPPAVPVGAEVATKENVFVVTAVIVNVPFGAFVVAVAPSTLTVVVGDT